MDKHGLLLNHREGWQNQFPSINVLTSKKVHIVSGWGGGEEVFINIRVQVIFFFTYEFWAKRFCLKRPIHSQLNWAMLLCDAIPNGKKTEQTAQFWQAIAQASELSFPVVFQKQNCAVHSVTLTGSSVFGCIKCVERILCSQKYLPDFM